MVKHDRVGLYIMPETRLKLNLVKAQISTRAGRPLNQDETIEHLIQLFERAASQSNGHLEFIQRPESANA